MATQDRSPERLWIARHQSMNQAQIETAPFAVDGNINQGERRLVIRAGEQFTFQDPPPAGTHIELTSTAHQLAINLTEHDVPCLEVSNSVVIINGPGTIEHLRLADGDLCALHLRMGVRIERMDVTSCRQVALHPSADITVDELSAGSSLLNLQEGELRVSRFAADEARLPGKSLVCRELACRKVDVVQGRLVVECLGDQQVVVKPGCVLEVRTLAADSTISLHGGSFVLQVSMAKLRSPLVAMKSPHLSVCFQLVVGVVGVPFARASRMR